MGVVGIFWQERITPKVHRYDCKFSQIKLLIRDSCGVTPLLNDQPNGISWRGGNSTRGQLLYEAVLRNEGISYVYIQRIHINDYIHYHLSIL